MPLLTGRASASRRAWGAPSGRSSPSRRSIRPRCGRRAFPRTAWHSERAVDLVELLEDPILLIKWNARPGVCHRHREMAVLRAGGNAHLSASELVLMALSPTQ